MNSERLLKHFERISEAPEAVARLRRFILDLAVRGKLVAQDSNDEPAAELLKRIQAEKARCEKKPKIFTPVSDDEGSFDVPSGWEWVRIRQITTDRGQTVPKGDFTYIDVTAINKERGCIGEPAVLSASEAPSRARKVVQEGDVIYSCVRPYLLNIAIIDTNITPSPIASTAFAVMNGFGLTLPRYLWIALRSPFMVESVEVRMRGQAYPAINDSDFSLLPLPLPPLAEQHRIVAKVDELMGLCDQLEAARNEREARRDRLVAASLHHLQKADDLTPSRQEAKKSPATGKATLGASAPRREPLFLQSLPRLTTRPEHIKQLRQTILNLAVRGCLVPQDPNDEPAITCLTRIGLKSTASLENDAKEDGADFPVSWVPVRFEDIAVVTGGVTLGRKLGVRKTVTLPYLRVANVKRGELDLRVMKEVSIAEDELERYSLHENDLLMTEGGDWDKVGRAAIWRREIPCCLHQNHIFRARMRSQEIIPFWFELYFNSPVGRSYFESASKQTTNLASINMRQVRGCPVPFPPLAEQHHIIAKVDELMALCDQLETQLTTSQADSRRLLEAVLRDALAPALAEAI